MPNSVNEPLTDDAFLGGLLHIQQPRKAYRAGIDAVLLAAAVPISNGGGMRVLDAGAGVGVVGLCVARCIANVTVTLVEIERSLADIARSNICRNGLGDRVNVVSADIAEGGAAFGASRPENQLPIGGFDHVLANPPFQTMGEGSTPPDRRKSRAHEMAPSDLDGWLRFMATACAAGGMATLIHRATALPELIAAMSPRFGNLTLLPIHPRHGQPANRIILQGTKGSKAPLAILPGLVLHNAVGNGYRSDVDAVLRAGARLRIGT